MKSVTPPSFLKPFKSESLDLGNGFDLSMGIGVGLDILTRFCNSLVHSKRIENEELHIITPYIDENSLQKIANIAHMPFNFKLLLAATQDDDKDGHSYLPLLNTFCEEVSPDDEAVQIKLLRCLNTYAVEGEEKPRYFYTPNFHIKLYFLSSDGTYLGSINLTSKGIDGNIESLIRIPRGDASKQIDSLFQHYWASIDAFEHKSFVFKKVR